MTRFSQYIPNEAALCDFGARLMAQISPLSTKTAVTCYLNGELGAGKTTLSRGMIQSLGYQGNVKSPTYTLVEEYQLQDKRIYHFDLYRLSDPEELEFMGIRDYFSANCICLIEWAEKGADFLATPDLEINIAYAEEGRTIDLVAVTDLGQRIVEHLNIDQLNKKG